MNDGGPAFPGKRTEVVALNPDLSADWGEQVVFYPGMSLRAYFAGQALAGLLANPETNDNGPMIIQSCLMAADALIAELEKGDE